MTVQLPGICDPTGKKKSYWRLYSLKKDCPDDVQFSPHVLVTNV